MAETMTEAQAWTSDLNDEEKAAYDRAWQSVRHNSELAFARQRLSLHELRHIIQAVGAAFSTGFVRLSVYESAVKGRQDFRSALRYSREKATDFEGALKAIAANTCCDKCREAALVAQKALDRYPSEPL